MTTCLLTSCKLNAKDCYVFDDSEFTSLWQEDKSKLDDKALRIMSANVLVHFKDWGGNQLNHVLTALPRLSNTTHQM